MGNSAEVLPPPPVLTPLSSISENLETFSLLWLDQNVNLKEENINAQKKLKTVINQLKTFENCQLCEEYIRKITDVNSIILIVSGRYGRELIPNIHDLLQLNAVYVYCMDVKANESLAKNYKKVKAVISDIDKLTEKLATDQTQREKTDGTVGIDIYKREASTTSLKSDNSSFMWFQLFVEVLLRMTHSSTSKTDLIDLCKKGNYENSKSIIDEFENTYSPEKSLWWYTRESFVYKILNKALRTQDIRVLIVFRFLIKDIYDQLKKEQKKQNNNNDSVFYRGQVMTKDEITKIQSSINEFISMRSFLSTTTDRRVAESFAQNANTNLEKVFFEIHAKHSTLTPFALISELSYFKSENEVLFMLGCIFRIENVYFDNQMNIWIVKLVLSSTQDDHDLKQLFDYLKREIGNETNFYSLAIILRKMGELHHAEECLKQHLLQSPSLSNDACRCYHALGNIYQERGDLEKALIYHKYSLDLKLQISSKDYADIGNSYNSIGADYEKRNDLSLALRSYEKARKIWLKCYNDKHERLAMVYNNLGIIYRKLKTYPQAIENHTKALTIRQATLPENHPDIASSYINLATVYMDMKNLDDALKNFQVGLDIQQKSLSSNHRSLALTLYNIGSAYETKNEFKLALDYYVKAMKIYQHTVTATHPEFIQTDDGIKRCKLKLKLK